MPLSIVSESYDLVLSGLVSTPPLSILFATLILRPKSGRRFSDRYTVRNYHQDQVELLQRCHPLPKDFDEAVQWEGDLFLKAELHRFREKVRMIKAKREEVQELEDDIWKLELGRVGSLRRLTGAQILKRVERANKGKMRELIQEYKRRRGRRS